MIFQSIRFVCRSRRNHSIICVTTILINQIKKKKKEKEKPTILQFILPSVMYFPNKKIANDLAELSVAAPIDVFSLTSLSGNGAGSIIQLSSSASLRLYIPAVCICICTSAYRRFFAEGCACMAPLRCTHVSHRVIYHRA